MPQMQGHACSIVVYGSRSGRRRGLVPILVHHGRFGYPHDTPTAFVLMEIGGPTGIRTQNQRIMLTTSTFAAGKTRAWSGPCLHRAVAGLDG